MTPLSCLLTNANSNRGCSLRKPVASLASMYCLPHPCFLTFQSSHGLLAHLILQFLTRASQLLTPSCFSRASVTFCSGAKGCSARTEGRGRTARAVRVSADMLSRATRSTASVFSYDQNAGYPNVCVACCFTRTRVPYCEQTTSIYATRQTACRVCFSLRALSAHHGDRSYILMRPARMCSDAAVRSRCD